MASNPRGAQTHDAERPGFALVTISVDRPAQDVERVAKLQWRPIEQAAIFVALGDRDRAFEALERAIPLGPVRVGRDLTYPELAPLRGDPRVKTLRKKLGLPE